MNRSFNMTVCVAATALLCSTTGFALAKDRQDSVRASVQSQPATVTMEQAIATAKAKFPGRVIESELESEDGGLVYEVKIVSASGETQEVEIDAQSGKILDSENEHKKDHDALESEKS